MSTATEPHYIPVIRELLRRHGDEIKPGRAYEIRTRHDDWCVALKGRPHACDCEPICDLVELSPPEFN